jgi:opine dehydrogenase
VLGGGGTGLMMAADLTLRGHEVRLWEDERHFGENLAAVQAAGGIEVTGAAVSGFAPLPVLTSSLAEAVQGADAILIAMLTERHLGLSVELAPLLQGGQAVCFSAGNGSSVALRRLVESSHGKAAADITVGEMGGNIYPCRLAGPAKLVCAFPYAPKAASAFPARDTARLLSAFSGVYELVAAKNVLAALLNSPNLVIHLAGSLLNTAAIDKDPGFLLYSSGLSVNVLKVAGAVEEERVRVLEAMGYPALRHLPMLTRVAEYGKHPELEIFRSLAGPSSLTHRYVTEDAGFGQSILVSLAAALGMEVPANKALMRLAGIVCSTDFLAQGATLATLGCSASTPEAISMYFEKGVA